jgi:methyl-accepting chemotaxis protein
MEAFIKKMRGTDQVPLSFFHSFHYNVKKYYTKNEDVAMGGIGMAAWLTAMRKPAGSRGDASNEAEHALLLRMVQEAVVISDRLAAVVAEVDSGRAALESMAESAQEQERRLREHGRSAMERLEEAFAALQEMEGASEHVRDASETMYAQSRAAGDAALEVNGSLLETDVAMSELSGHHAEMEHKVRLLADEASRIGEIHSLIREMVAQTSLLALNAEIEAAHAGESGRGFSVIAMEIRKLAEQSGEAVKRSAAVLHKIEAGILEVVESVRQEKRSVVRCVEETGKNRKRIDAILQRIVKVDEQVGHVKEAAQEQSVRTETANRLLREVVDSVERTWASVEDTVAQNVRQRREIANLGRVSKELQAAAGELTDAVRQTGGRVWRGDAQVDASRWTALLAALSADPALTGMVPSEHRRKLSRWLADTPGAAAVWSNSPDGAFVFSEPEAGLLNAKGREWWRQAMEGRTFVSEVYLSAITKKPCVTVSVPIRGEDGRPVGVLGVDIEIS